MARAATDSQRAGLTGLEFGLAIPGTVGGAVWANAGAHDADVAGVLEAALRAGRGRHGVAPDAGRSGPGLPRTAGFKRLPARARTPWTPPVPRRRGRPRHRDQRHVPPHAGRRRHDQGAPRRDQAAGARPTSRSASRAPAASSATRRAIHPPARLIDEAGLKGLPDRRRERQREARQLPRQRRPRHARPTSAAWAITCARVVAERFGVDLGPRSCSSATGPAGPSLARQRA